MAAPALNSAQLSAQCTAPAVKYTLLSRALSYTADEKFGPIHAASVGLELGMIVAVHFG